MSEEYEWGTPPTIEHSLRGRRIRFVKALRDRPGEWAKYPKEFKDVARAQTGASAFRKNFPGIEAVVSGVHVWARAIREDEDGL